MMKTEVFHLSKMTKRQLTLLKTALLSGAPCILPSDTVYGLMALATANKARENLNKIKNNPQNKPTQILCTLKQAEILADNKDQLEQAQKYWPGALTAILTASKEGKKYSGIDTIGLRVPNDTFLLDLMENLISPLLATSANLHGQEPCKNTYELLNIFDGIVPCIVLDENSSKNTPSKIIDYTKNPPQIIR